MIGSGPRLLAPEVVQTSAMDCGPAALKCVLAGFGIEVSYNRLRQAFQTDVDGTSIDSIEDAAIQLGLDAEQVVVPADHVLLRGHEALPAIAVVRQPNNALHFVVAWRRFGSFIQVMDPGSGRRWVTKQRFLRTLYSHQLLIPATDWHEWAVMPNTSQAMTDRLKASGVDSGVAARIVADASRNPSWRSLAFVDAAARMIHAIVSSGGIKRGREVTRLIERLSARSMDDDKHAIVAVPVRFWSAQAAGIDSSGREQIRIIGAVLCTMRSRRSAHWSASTSDATASPLAPRSVELALALKERGVRPGRILLRLLWADGSWAMAALLAVAAFAAVGLVIEALLLRSLIDVGTYLSLTGQRVSALAALGALAVMLLLVEVSVSGLARTLGRRLEGRLRVAFLSKMPRLDDRYFRTRLMSDLAERAHSLHRIRQLPEVGTQAARILFELLFVTAAITWIDPPSAMYAVLSAVTCCALPFIVQPALQERDLGMRTIAGGLCRYYLDSLVGLTAIQTHGAERAVRVEHDGLLVEWARAGFGYLHVAIAAEAFQLLAGFGIAALLLIDRFSEVSEPGAVLLVMYWTLSIPLLGQELIRLSAQYPGLRNATLRLLEPLGLEDSAGALRTDGAAAQGQRPPAEKRGVEIGFHEVEVHAAGHTILSDLSMRIADGSHVAVTGVSGAGKSSLLGLLLGWHRPVSGSMTIDGQPLDERRLESLRASTAWIDPAVQLWNRSLADNLVYGSPHDGLRGLNEALHASELHELLEHLPKGLQTPLGEAGRAVSEGEGQRVRFGRAFSQRASAQLVLLDEPFRGLERPRRTALLARARALWAHATLLCITHDVGESLMFDRVLVMHEGRVVEDGNPAALALQSDSRYRGLLNAEESARTLLLDSKTWRRLRVEGRQAAFESPEAEP